MNQNIPEFSEVKNVRVIQREGQSEVNEALQLGWQLLFVQKGYDCPIFVLGWTQSSEPPLTKSQKQYRALYATSERGTKSLAEPLVSAKGLSNGLAPRACRNPRA